MLVATNVPALVSTNITCRDAGIEASGLIQVKPIGADKGRIRPYVSER